MQYDAADKERHQTLEGTALQNVDNINYFVVTITEGLRWNTHASNIYTKGTKTLSFLR